MVTKLKKTRKLTLFGPRDRVFKKNGDGIISVNLDLVRQKAEGTPLPRLGRFYSDIKPQVMSVLGAVEEVFIRRMQERVQEFLPIADDDGVPTGQELVLKHTFVKTDVDDELILKAQERMALDGYKMELIKTERLLVLDKETMKAFGITEAKLKQYQDKIRMTSVRKDLHALKKAARTGGVGGDIIRRAITTKKGALRVYLNDVNDQVQEKEDDGLGGSQ